MSYPMGTPLKLTVFACYRVETVKGRVLDLMFRGSTKSGTRLWFTELDPPYGDVFLRPRHIMACSPLYAGK